MSDGNNFLLLNNITKVNLYVEKLLSNFPNKERVLNDNIKSTMYELVKLTNSYNINYKKLIREKNLVDILINLSMLDYYLLISYKKDYIKKRQYNSACRMLTEVRKIAYCLVNYEKNRV